MGDVTEADLLYDLTVAHPPTADTLARIAPLPGPYLVVPWTMEVLTP